MIRHFCGHRRLLLISAAAMTKGTTRPHSPSSTRVNIRVSSSSTSPSSSLNQIFLHVGPSGDCWTGSSIFAAKHLQPDYVKSIPIPPNVCPEILVEQLEENITLMQQIYDDGVLPLDILERAIATDEFNDDKR